MCAYLSGTVTPSRSLNTPLPFVALAGIASFALFCRTISSFFKSRPRSYSVNLNSTEKFRYNTNLPNVYADGEEMVDRISQLSDDIICLIITQLSARAAVRTSVLSRRWRNLYRFIPIVRFHCLDMYGVNHHDRGNLYPLQRKFVEGVDTFLQHHSGHKITCLSLSCCFSGSILHKFRKWMQSLGGFGVEQLILFYCCSSAEFHKPTFSFQLLSETSSVKHLHLNDCSLQPTFKGQCNSLKFLVLTNVALDVAAVDCILSTCENLQSLKFFQCILPSKLRIHGPDLKLKILIASLSKNVKEIDLYAANLITFEYSGWEMPTLSLSYIPLLQKLCIRLSGDYVVPGVLGKLAKDLAHLRSLIFMASGNFYLGCKLSGLSNKLSNLRRLVLTLVEENGCDLLRITPILDACPLLEKFHLSMVESTFNGRQVEKSATFHPSLKQVRLSGFCGTRNQMSFALYILKSAVVLGQMSISPRFCYYVRDDTWFEKNASSSWDEEKRRMIQERLQGQAISKSAKIITL